MATLHRRDWLKQSSLLFAGIGIGAPLTAGAVRGLQLRTSQNFFPPDGPICLSSNENPYGPSPLARQAMQAAINGSNRYPWDLTTSLREKIGAQYEFDKDHVLMGAGSSEILGLVAHLAALQKGNAVTADPTFSTWAPSAQRMGLEVVKVPLTADKKHDLKAMLSKVNKDTRLFYLCNPNNPSGTVLPVAEIAAAVREAAKQCYVLLDEAYVEYSGEPSQSPLIKETQNLIIAKTFSKIHGLAGARIGYALAHPDTINALADLQPWNNAGVSAVSLAGAMASLSDKGFLSNSKTWNREAGAYTEKELTALGFTVIPSHTNFIYYSLNGYKHDWLARLKEKNVLSGRMVEPAGQWTRTTIGTLGEMKTFVAAAKAIV